jgi:hypothetical protein
MSNAFRLMSVKFYFPFPDACLLGGNSKPLGAERAIALLTLLRRIV